MGHNGVAGDAMRGVGVIDKLKHCPFCGNEAEYLGEALLCCVRCTRCKASVGWVIDSDQDSEDVVAAWNTRAKGTDGE